MGPVVWGHSFLQSAPWHVVLGQGGPKTLAKPVQATPHTVEPAP
jgi:hypothetical protein